ncbi:hypothetical protein K6H10_004730 [Candida tropicalis]
MTTGRKLVDLVENETRGLSSNGVHSGGIIDDDVDDVDEIVEIKTDDLGLSEDEMVPNNASTPINDELEEEEDQDLMVNGCTMCGDDDDSSGKKRPREENSETETSKRMEVNDKTTANNDNFGKVALTAITSDQS